MAGSVWAHGRGASVVCHGCLHAEEEAVASISAEAQSALDRGAGGLVGLEQICQAALASDADVGALAQQLAQLLGSAQERHGADSKFVDAAMSCIKLLIAKLRSLDKAVASLTLKLASMEKERSGLVLGREKVLLGQVAYVVDFAAASYVFATPKPNFITFPRLLHYRTKGRLSDDQVQRFDQFVAFLSKQGWDPETLNDTTGALRDVRLEAAHGEPTEQASVTEHSLLEWSDRHLDPVSAQSFKQLLPLIRQLTEPKKPLVLRSNVCTNLCGMESA